MGENKMKYANPRAREEFEFIVKLMEDCRNGIVPEGIIHNIRELYGDPIVSKVSYPGTDGFRRVRDYWKSLSK